MLNERNACNIDANTKKIINIIIFKWRKLIITIRPKTLEIIKNDTISSNQTTIPLKYADIK